MPRLVTLKEQEVNLLSEEAFLDEASLQGLLEEHPELIALDEVDPTAAALLPIGREITLAGQSLDLLFIDLLGKLTLVETKLRRNSQIRREVVGQVLEYGAFLSTWKVEDVERQAARYFADGRTPSRYRNQSLYGALSRLGASESGGEEPDESETRSRISSCLTRFDMRLVIAVDRVVDPLRTLVTFTNSASRFGMYLLEVQQYLAPDGLRIASINVYGGVPPVRDGNAGRGNQWDESRFLEILQSQCRADSRAVVEDLYAFARDEADSVVWGSGATEGSVGFGVRRAGDRFVIFWLTTKARIYFSTANVSKRAPQEARALLATLRSLGVDAPDELLQGDFWPAFDAARLNQAADLERFKSAVLAIRDSLGQQP